MPGVFKSGAITGEVDLNRGPAVETLRAIPKEAAVMKQGVERETREAAASMNRTFKTSLDGIKESFGRRSALGEGLELLRGAGPAMAIGIAVEGVKMLASGAEKVATDFRLGKISADEVAFSLAKQVPIVGSVLEIGESFSEVLSGHKAMVEAITRELGQQQELWKSEVDSAKELVALRARAGAGTDDVKTRIASVGADAFTKDQIEADAKERDRIRTRENRRQEMVASYQKDADARVDALESANETVAAKEADQKRGYVDLPDGQGGITRHTGATYMQRRVDAAKDDADKIFNQISEIGRMRKDAEKEFDTNEGTAGGSGQYGQLKQRQDAQRVLDERATSDAALTRAEAQSIKTRQAAKYDAMEAAGREDAAHIQEIQDKLENQKRDNAQRVLDDVKAAGPGADTSFINARVKLMEDQNAALNASAKAAIDRFKNDRAKELTDALATPLERYKEEVKKLDQELHDGIISQPQRDAAVAAEQNRASDSLGLNIIKTPVEKLNQEIDQVIKALNAGIIQKPEALRITHDLAQELKDSQHVDYQESQQTFRRFNFAETDNTPVVSSPMDNLIQIQTDAAADTKRGADAMESVNEKIQNVESWTPAPAI